MATYKEQLEEAQSYRLREGGSYLGNCPFCSGKKTYGVTLRNGVLLWGCFRASCGVRGGHGEGLSIAGIHQRVKGSDPAPTVFKSPIPSLLTSVANRPDAIKFLSTYNCLKSYEAGLIDIRYSPAEDRVMFPLGNHREPTGWAGRGRKGVTPKWKEYGDCTKLLTCGVGKTAVVVEDALSACAVGIIPDYTGCSLSGTILTQAHIIELRSFDRIIVALDPDAMSKGLDFASRLGSNATPRLIDNDLKYFEPDEIRRQLE